MIAAGLGLAEPDVALTDWALAVEAFVLAGWSRPHGRAWAAFFGSIGVAALLGGISHGFFPERQGLFGVALWRATMLALGVTSASAVIAGSRALQAGPGAFVRRLAVASALVYALVVVFVTDAFAVAVVGYLPATLFLLAMFAAAARRAENGGAWLGAAGLLVLLAGSWVQWRGIGVPALGLTHNALFHVIQMLALPLIYQGVRDGGAREA